MEENEEQNLDSEYKRYLEIMRPYLGQLLDQDIIEICNAWIQRLSYCHGTEKILRNKYIFALCYQLAKGILEEPFLNIPSPNKLAPLLDGTNTEKSVNESSEVEYLVLDLDSTKTKVLYNNHTSPNTGNLSHCSEFETDQSNEFQKDNKNSNVVNSDKRNELKNSQTLICYQLPNTFPDYKNINIHNNNYENRANNLIVKLREIKKQNLMLHNELMSLREESRMKQESVKLQDDILKIDNATSAYICSQDSNTTLNSLKIKLQEVQESRNALIETISNLQDKLDNFNEMKKHEIDDIYAQHKLEIIQVKTSLREEIKASYEQNLEEIKQQNEQLIKDIESKNLKEMKNLTTSTEATIKEKDQTIQSRESEITQLKNYIDKLKNNQYSMFSKFCDQSNNYSSSKCVTQKAEELERRLNKMEKSKVKYSKAYEAKLAKVQREKHLNECTLQLQLVKQRAQVIHDTADEYQTELATALDKLEAKYKDIVANVQATAVQRRIQDQMALESIIQTVCGVRNEDLPNSIPKTTYTNQFLSNKAMRNQTRDGHQSCDNELATVIRDNNVGNVIVGNKSFEGDSMVNGYCLDGEKLGELFERVCIPQRDTGECSPKK